MTPKILIAPTHCRYIDHIYGPILRPLNAEFVFPPRDAQMTEEELLAVIPGCVASLAGSEPYTRHVIETAAAAGLKVIARAGVGYDAVDLKAAADHGVAVAYAPGSNHEAVGEHVMLLILALAKNLIPQDAAIRRGEWPRRSHLSVRGKTLGIVGLGRTGKAVSRRAVAFGMNIIAVDPVKDFGFALQHDISFVTLPKLLHDSDVVSLHVPLTPETNRMINAKTLAMMKPTAFLINASRGDVVDETDLEAALRQKKILGAGLDVYEVEPPIGSPLLDLDNVVLTAHTAGIDERARDNMTRVAAEAIARLLRGERPTEWMVSEKG